MTSAAITPGTHPQNVKSSTIKNEPQPFPITDKGGKIMANSTRRKLMYLILIDVLYTSFNFHFCYRKSTIFRQ